MRRLADRQVMKRGVSCSGFWSCLSASFDGVEDRIKAWWLMAVILIWAMFFLWLFVFAWHEEHGGGRVFQFKMNRHVWGVAVVAAFLWGALMSSYVDPSLRELNPKGFPEREHGIS